MSTPERPDVLPDELESNARVGVRKNSGASTLKRRRVNFIEGSNVVLTVADDAIDEEVDVTIDVTGAAAYSDEKAQDAVGLALTDSASVDFTYNDAANTITADVLPAGVDHNSLTNLATGDVHTHYAKLAGRAGGQTLIGGTAASENLTLQSTSSATLGQIRVSHPIVFVPPGQQAITAATQAIGPIASSTHRISADASYTLTSTPTIANGAISGQIVIIYNIDTVDVITIQDQGTLPASNLRLGAATRALGPRDNITLMWSADIGDWIEIAFTNVI